VAQACGIPFLLCWRNFVKNSKKIKINISII
jgi:hypothetical protein